MDGIVFFYLINTRFFWDKIDEILFEIKNKDLQLTFLCTPVRGVD